VRLRALWELTPEHVSVRIQHLKARLMSYTENRIRGAIFGQAIGDAIGHPVEFKKTHTVTTLIDHNQFTDDTQMMCAIGEALVEYPPHESEEDFMACLSDRFVDWKDAPLGGGHRAPGRACMNGAQRLGAGSDWASSGDTTAKGNGSAMRSSIVGAYYWANPEYAFYIGGLTSIPTHSNLESVLGSGLVSYLVARAIQATLSFQDSVVSGISLCANFSRIRCALSSDDYNLGVDRNQAAPWRLVNHFYRAYLAGQSRLIAPAEFAATNGDDFAVGPAVSAAIYYATRSHSYSEAVLDAANFGDDADTIAAITGALVGAREGTHRSGNALGVPEDWVQRIELSEYLENLTQRVIQSSANASTPIDVSEGDADDLLDMDDVEF
jgi:ADP-ribosyl-[dinitrogen reductase] hydrolase